MPADIPRDGALDLVLDGASDGLGRLGGLPVPQGPDYPLVVDDFEDNDLGEYTGDLSSATVQSTTVEQGTYALEMQGSFKGSTVFITSLSELSYYPQAGDQFRVKIRQGGEGSFAGFNWCVDTDAATNSYAVWHDAGALDPGWQLRKYDGGSVNVLAEQAISLFTNEWMTATVDHADDGTIEAVLYDSGDAEVARISATDTTFSSGGVGFSQNNSGPDDVPSWYDIAKITGGNR